MDGWVDVWVDGWVDECSPQDTHVHRDHVSLSTEAGSKPPKSAGHRVLPHAGVLGGTILLSPPRAGTWRGLCGLHSIKPPPGESNSPGSIPGCSWCEQREEGLAKLCGNTPLDSARLCSDLCAEPAFLAPSLGLNLTSPGPPALTEDGGTQLQEAEFGCP